METPPEFIEYPRPPQQNREYYGPPTVRLGALGEAWNLLWKDPGTWVVMNLLVIVLGAVAQAPGQVAQMVMSSTGRPDPASIIAAMAVGFVFSGVGMIVQQVLIAGFYGVAIRRFRGESAGIGDMFNLNGMGWHVVLFSVVVFGTIGVIGIVAAGAWIATLGTLVNAREFPVQAIWPFAGVWLVLVFAFFAVFILLALTPAIIVDQKLPAIPAMKRSWQAVMPHFWRMLLLYIVASICGGLGVIACCVGVIFTMPLLYLSTAIVYRDLFMAQEDPTQPIIRPYTGGFEA